MAKYVYLLGGADLDKRHGDVEFSQQVREEFLQWLRALREKGHFEGSHRLKDQTGVRLTGRHGQVAEGPFIEAKEAVGGLCFIEAASLEEAVNLARSCPILVLQNAFIEVRTIDVETTAAGL